MKNCSKCNKKKELTEFKKNYNKCKSCVKAKREAHYQANKEKILAQNKVYKAANKEKIATQKKVWDANNKEAIKAYRDANKETAKAHVKANRPKINERARNRKKTDDLFALKMRLRCRTSEAFRIGGYSKNTKTEDTLGCDWATLKIHIEKQFTDTMSWSKPKSFQIDHIKPLANAKTKEELIERCHYTNLQPLPPEVNMMKATNCIGLYVLQLEKENEILKMKIDLERSKNLKNK
jgi:hypothetical protein